MTSIIRTWPHSIFSRLQNKLMLIFAGIGGIAVVLVSVYSFELAKEALLQRTFEQLTGAREAKQLGMEEFIHSKLDGAELAAKAHALRVILPDLRGSENFNFDHQAVNTFMAGGSYSSLSVVFDTANFRLGRFTDRITFTAQAGPQMREHLKEVYLSVGRSGKSEVFDLVAWEGGYVLTFGAPVFNSDGELVAVVALTVPHRLIDRIMAADKTNRGLGVSGETYLVGADRLMRSSSRFDPSSVMRTKVNSEAVVNAFNGESNTFIVTDYRDIPVLSSYAPLGIDGLNWVILSEIDREEVLAPVRRLWSQLVAASAIILLAFIIAVVLISRHLARPLIRLRSLTSDIASGGFGQTITATTSDEVGQLTQAVNSMSLQIQDQWRQLEEKNREILDSITYAKRIQMGLLPSQRLIESLLSDSFVLYMPKHIVSGDFYYLGSEDGQIVIAVGDCTGHGVPGAMISGICLGALQRVIKVYRHTQPSIILDRLNEVISEMFSASDLDIHDGMDISICSISLNGQLLQFAGANNSLLYIREGGLHELKADRQAIGGAGQANPFRNYELSVRPGDCIYLFSDGYIDQFGGDEAEEKFKRKRLRQLLLDIHQRPMVTQRFLLEEAFQKWKGGLEQVDDICVFGVRL